MSEIVTVETVMGALKEVSDGIRTVLENSVVGETSLCPCGHPYDFGCHGVRDGQVYSEYRCKKCHNEGDRS